MSVLTPIHFPQNHLGMNDCENEIATETFLQSVQLYSFQNCTFDDGLENVSSIDTKKMILSRHLISDEGYFGSWKEQVIFANGGGTTC